MEAETQQTRVMCNITELALKKTFSLGYYVTMPEGWESFSLLCDLKETSSAL